MFDCIAPKNTTMRNTQSRLASVALDGLLGAGTSAPSAPHLTVSLFLHSPRGNGRGEVAWLLKGVVSAQGLQANHWFFTHLAPSVWFLPPSQQHRPCSILLLWCVENKPVWDSRLAVWKCPIWGWGWQIWTVGSWRPRNSWWCLDAGYAQSHEINSNFPFWCSNKEGYRWTFNFTIFNSKIERVKIGHRNSIR